MDRASHIFERIYAAHQDELFRFCLARMRNREEALDMTQETFVKTYEYLRKGEHIDNERAFLYRVARNGIIDKSRKKKEQSLDLMLDEGFDPISQESSPLMLAEYKEAVELLDHLPPDYREVVYMRHVEEMSVEEIAGILGVTPNVVSVRIHRGIEKLKEYREN